MDQPYVTESARLTGVEEFTAIDLTFGTAILTATDFDIDSLAGVPFWRTTTTQVGGRPETTQQLVRVYRVEGPVELLGESGPGVARVYRPALVELPADVAAGANWSGAGSAGANLDYRSEFRAEASERGCLQVTGTLTFTGKDGRAGSTETVRRGWCPHEGITSEQTTSAGATVTDSALRGLPSAPSIRTTTSRWRGATRAPGRTVTSPASRSTRTSARAS